jgi:hypothetical protein
MYSYRYFKAKTHRLIPSRYPPVSLFDWAKSPQELEELALLEGLSNDRLNNALGTLLQVPKEDWVLGEGTTPLMAAFTHPGRSRFSDGSFGIYYAGDSLETAIAETKFHRERFLSASNEPPCLIQMREYLAYVNKKLVNLNEEKYRSLLNPDVNLYTQSQQFGQELKQHKEWGMIYPSVRRANAQCIAILRPPALTIPIQGCHLNYVWNGLCIEDISQAKNVIPAIT